MSHVCCRGALQGSSAAVFRQITAGQSDLCRLACPVWHQTLAPWPSMISHKHNKAEWPMLTGLSSLAPDPGPMALCNSPQSCMGGEGGEGGEATRQGRHGARVRARAMA